jgi:hypothetical protein
LKTAGRELPRRFPDYHDNLALAVLFPAKLAITVMCFDISELHSAATDLAFPRLQFIFSKICRVWNADAARMTTCSF